MCPPGIRRTRVGPRLCSAQGGRVLRADEVVLLGQEHMHRTVEPKAAVRMAIGLAQPEVGAQDGLEQRPHLGARDHRRGGAADPGDLGPEGGGLARVEPRDRRVQPVGRGRSEHEQRLGPGQAAPRQPLGQEQRQHAPHRIAEEREAAAEPRRGLLRHPVGEGGEARGLRLAKAALAAGQARRLDRKARDRAPGAEQARPAAGRRQADQARPLRHLGAAPAGRLRRASTLVDIA